MITMPLLKDIKYTFKTNEPVIKYPYHQISDEIRIYYVLDSAEKTGFDFIALEWAARSWEDNKILSNDWNPEFTEVEILYHGIAAFDGIRHLYTGHQSCDNVGYLNYPTMDYHTKIMKKLSEMEKEHCHDKAEIPK